MSIIIVNRAIVSTVRPRLTGHQLELRASGAWVGDEHRRPEEEQEEAEEQCEDLRCVNSGVGRA